MGEESKKEKKERSYGKEILVLAIVVTMLAVMTQGPKLVESISKRFEYNPDFFVGTLETTKPFDNSILNEESLLYTIDPKLEVSENFSSYNDLRCSFSYENLSKKILENPILKIFLIDPIDRVIAYGEHEISGDNQKVKFIFEEGIGGREIKGDVRILVTIWSREGELAGYAIHVSKYLKGERSFSFILAFITILVTTLVGLSTVVRYSVSHRYRYISITFFLLLIIGIMYLYLIP